MTDRSGVEWGGRPWHSPDEHVLECCGQPVDDDGYCQHRSHHPRQITPALLNKAVAQAARYSDLHAQVRAVLELAFAEAPR